VVNSEWFGNNLIGGEDGTGLRMYNNQLFKEYTDYRLTAIEVDTCAKIILNGVTIRDMKGTFGAGIHFCKQKSL
jgi:hypothetical protein